MAMTAAIQYTATEKPNETVNLSIPNPSRRYVIYTTAVYNSPPSSIRCGFLNTLVINAIRKISTPNTQGLMLSARAAPTKIGVVKPSGNTIIHTLKILGVHLLT